MTFDVDAETAKAMARYGAGDFAQAGDICRRIVAADPDHAESIHLLGVLAHHAGRHREALELIGKAIRLNDQNPQFHNNLGLAHGALGAADLAIECYRQAIALRPDFAIARMNLGSLMRDIGRPDDALAQFREIVAVDPGHARAHASIGSVLAQRGQLDEALVHFRGALAASPNDAEAHNDIGVAFSKQEKLREALVHFRRAVELKPNFREALGNLATTLADVGEFTEALTVTRRALDLKETEQVRTTFVRCVSALRVFPDTGPAFRGLLTRALTEPWGRPLDIAGAGVVCLKADPAIRKCMERVTKAWPERPTAGQLYGLSRLDAIARNQLLLAVLESSPVNDMEIERLLTCMRFALLQTATGKAGSGHIKEAAARFYGALTQQCFINGYVYACTDGEREQAGALRASLAAALASGSPVPALWPIALAAYAPLHSLDNTDALLARTWRDGVDAVLTQQVREPRQEAELRTEIPLITAITDDVSNRVRGHYEENPFPCWVKAAPATRDQTLLALLRKPDDANRLSILVAGCGTGQHSIETARNYPEADLLAIDLSLASLGYALRKTREAGVTNLQYAQADILELASLDRKFDLIEASGVLHHLANPADGWRALLSVLRPGGLMRVGLYSELGRRDVSIGQAFIAGRGYGPSARDIQTWRQDLWDARASHPMLEQLAARGDFYSLSNCRDLLFHVQEHRFTIPSIKSFVAEHGLTFIGFGLPRRIVTNYRSLHPQDASAADLDLWHVFESSHPNTFVGMYQFWVRSRAP